MAYQLTLAGMHALSGKIPFRRTARLRGAGETSGKGVGGEPVRLHRSNADGLSRGVLRPSLAAVCRGTGASSMRVKQVSSGASDHILVADFFLEWFGAVMCEWLRARLPTRIDVGNTIAVVKS